MAGTTTNFAIPYPSSTDYVTDGATAMKSLADQVDAAMFTGSSSGNLLINGAMQVTQRQAVGNVVTGITTSGYQTADRWKTTISSLGTFSQTTLADAPAGSGFRNCLRLQCTTADASPAAGDFLILQQIIEGQNLQAIRKGTASAQTLTLSFWVASFQTGTFIVELADSDNSRSCSKSYTVNASNTWEYKTVTFPADVTGTLNNDANASLEVNFWLGAGTTYTSGTLATTWGTLTSANRAVGVSNLASSTSNKWHITGAQLTVGSVATPFEFKSYANDLRACQRYYEKSYTNGIPYGSNNSDGVFVVSGSTDATGYIYATISMKTPKRIDAPTGQSNLNSVFKLSTTTGTADQVFYYRSAGNAATTTCGTNNVGNNNVAIYVNAGGSFVSCLIVFHWVYDAEL
jgi:hypothetical protein